MTTVLNEIKEPVVDSDINYEIMILGEVSTNNVNLNVKMYPNVRSLVVGYLLPKTRVEIVGEYGQWYKIRFNNKEAYVVKQEIFVNESIHIQKGAIINKFGKVINIDTNLTVRKDPIDNSNAVGYLLPEALVTILDEDNQWYKLLFNSGTGEKEGYVKNKYINII